ncbi:PucR family transcriptional regulator [Nocardioides massiliensis]|uniref:Purine catabolism regulator n=1 Tax=Nocardioides massiliensis TaxID=1325935 RepID=A0ABT9NIF0_9ACTN|nr:PucR family transcriptional regulator [Nocardioides massiliensis]MDP9820196.1 purine catabolism regulator [Nocardioides massiliensis]
MRDSYRVPVRDVLEVGGLLKSRILAGQGGQGRTITTVSIVEAPDVLDWVRPHTFVMTGGFPLRHLDPTGGLSTAGLCRFLSQLDDLEVAGLGVQFGTHLDELPPEVLELADELEFPIVSLPADVPFDQLFSQMMVDVAGVQNDVLQRTYELHALLEGLLLEGADVQRIAEQIASVLALGVLVTSVDGRQMAAVMTEEMRAELAEADLYDETGRFRVERIRTPAQTAGGGQLVAEPIVAAGNDLARLVAFAPEHAIGEDVRYALQRAASLLALQITQRQALNVVENKYRGDFLRDVLSGRSKNREHAEVYAVGLGWRLDMPCIVVAAQIDPQDPREEPASTRVRRAWQSRFHLAWTQVVGRESPAYPVADFGDEVVVILSLPEGREDLAAEPAAAVAELQQMVERIVRSVSGDRGGGRRPFSVGTSRLVRGFEQLPAAYQQARRATEVGRRFTGGSSTSHFDNLGIHRLIGLIPDIDELTVFAQDILGELAEETAQATELRTTLQVLLDHNLNVAEASRELLMHYNTMRYRIGKLEKILGPFTTDANLRLNVAVALEVHKIQQ